MIFVAPGLTAYLSLAWQHEFLDSGMSVAARFAEVGGSFAVETPHEARNAAGITVGLNGSRTSRSSIYLNYSALAGDGSYLGNAIQGGFAIAF